MIAPCKDCQDRVLGCHSTCRKYIKFRMWKDLELHRKMREQQESNVLNSRLRRTNGSRRDSV